MNKERVVAYIDGFNLYYGMKETKRNDLLWLNVQLLTSNLLRDYQELIETNYFTSRISKNLPKEGRQKEYLEALMTLENFKIHYGKYNSQNRTCKKCNHTYPHSSEKMTDVNIACSMLSDAFNNKYDTAFLITGDSDLVPPIRLIQSIFPEKKVFVAFPPNRHSNDLKQLAKGSMMIKQGKILKSQFPNQVIKQDGYILNRPSTWI